MKISRKKFKRMTGISLVMMGLVIGSVSIFTAVPLLAAEPAQVMTAELARVKQWAFIGAAFAFGCGAIGASFAISSVGSAAMGALSEKPELGGQALIFIALAEGLVIFGFITALMILGKV